jgi:hypothetical protein
MSATLLEILTEQSEQLSADEQLMLAMRLIDRVRLSTQTPPATMTHKWSDLRGAFPHPLTGEDAQSWVSRTRREGDELRDSHRGPAS